MKLVLEDEGSNPRRPTPAGPKPAPLAWLGDKPLSESMGSVDRLRQDGGSQVTGLAAIPGLRVTEGAFQRFPGWLVDGGPLAPGQAV